MPLINATGVSKWTPERLTDLTGQRFLITGGNSGIGFEAAKRLAERNADIVIGARNASKGETACAAIAPLGAGRTELLQIDLADMASIRAAANEAKTRFGELSALINNAGIMQTPKQQTKDGFEMQLGTNHLGHFLWTALMIGQVNQNEGRVVTVASVAHKYGKIHFDDLMLDASYDPSTAYCQSKLANLLFAQELHRRLEKSGSAIKSVGCHPGYSSTELQSTGPTGFLNGIYKLTNSLLAQSSELGAYPTVLAAAGDEAVSGAYYGPTGIMDLRGPVGDSDVAPRALDEEVAQRLWTVSEELVGEKFTY
ncbi:MAG: oxidoreductase [Pseudomonadota bacterium]